MQELMKFFTSIGFQVDSSGLEALNKTLRNLEERLHQISKSPALAKVTALSRAEQRAARDSARAVVQAERKKTAAVVQGAKKQKSAVENIYSNFSVASKRNLATNRASASAGYSAFRPNRLAMQMKSRSEMHGPMIDRSKAQIMKMIGKDTTANELERTSRQLAQASARYASQINPLGFQIAKVKQHMQDLQTQYARGAMSQSAYNAQLNIAKQKLHNLNTMQNAGATGEGAGGGLLGFLAGTRFARSFAPERFPMGSMLGYGTGALGVGAALQNVTLVGEDIVGIQAGLEALSGSVETGQANFNKIASMADRLQMPMTDIGKNMVNMVAAVEGTPLAKNIIDASEGFYEFAVVTQRTPEQIQLAMRALGQMASKGKLSAEEVKNQFAEHIPGGLALFAEAAGFGKAEDSVSKLLDKMADGDLYAKDVLPKVFQLMREKAAPGLEKALGSSRFQRLGFQRELEKLIIAFNEAGWQETLAAFFGRLAKIMPNLVPVVEMLGKALSTSGQITGVFISLIENLGGALSDLNNATNGFLADLVKWLLFMNPLTRAVALLVYYGDELELFFRKILSIVEYLRGKESNWFGKQVEAGNGMEVVGESLLGTFVGLLIAYLLRKMPGKGSDAGAKSGGAGGKGGFISGMLGFASLKALWPVIQSAFILMFNVIRTAMVTWAMNTGKNLLIRAFIALIAAIAAPGLAPLITAFAVITTTVWALFEAFKFLKDKIYQWFNLDNKYSPGNPDYVPYSPIARPAPQNPFEYDTNYFKDVMGIKGIPTTPQGSGGGFTFNLNVDGVGGKSGAEAYEGIRSGLEFKKMQIIRDIDNRQMTAQWANGNN